MNKSGWSFGPRRWGVSVIFRQQSPKFGPFKKLKLHLSQHIIKLKLTLKISQVCACNPWGWPQKFVNFYQLSLGCHVD